VLWTAIVSLVSLPHLVICSNTERRSLRGAEVPLNEDGDHSSGTNVGTAHVETTSMAQNLFYEDSSQPIGETSTKFECGKPGTGTMEPAHGPGGCLNIQSFTDPFPSDMPQTAASFLVYPCGIVAPHLHANAAEVMTVVHGEGIIAQMPANGGDIQVSHVQEGDSFFFGQGNYHWWMNLGTTELLTVGVFTNTASPDTALMAYDDGAGIAKALMNSMPLLKELIGQSTGQKIVQDNPVFPLLDESYCSEARQTMANYAFTENSWQVAPKGASLFKGNELATGQYNIKETAVNGPGGGLLPLAGKVLEGMPFVTGTADTNYNGGISPMMPPSAVLWPGLTNVGGGKSLVKFVVGYCGLVAIHTHVNAAEWNTVINGKGTVSYFPVNGGDLVRMSVQKGDTFVFPQGTAHWWVNYSPNEQLVTVGGFTAPFPDTAMLEDFLQQSDMAYPELVDGVLGKGFTAAAELEQMNGAGTLFPLLSTRDSSNCGGDTMCNSCM